MAFRQMERSNDAMTLMGATVLASSLLSLFVVIKGQDSVLFYKCDKKEDEEDVQTKPTETS
jgi:hypothetical protein